MEEQSNNSSKKTGIIIAIVAIVVMLVSVWYGFMYLPEQEAKEKARKEQIAKEIADKKRAEQLAQKKAKYDQLIESADKEFGQEYWETAKSSYMEASSLFPKESYPKDQLALVNEKLDEIAAQEARKAAGIVETISSPTGSFYIVVSSSIDGDLAMDYASKMAKAGENVKVIEPYGKVKFYRVSLGDYNTLEEAQSESASYSSVDGEGVWVLKY